jgi:hypothetical protein
MRKMQVTWLSITKLAVATTLLLASCTTAKKSIIPVSDKTEFEDTYTIIWNGYSKAFAYEDGNWERAATFDYYFDVIQKRYKNEWKSVKSLHRIHPEYNGKAGERDQTMYFNVKYLALDQAIVVGQINASLGDGSVKTDPEFRKSEMVIDSKEQSAFIPYNKIRITQFYDYENGKLTETVELLKVKDGVETPFMKNEEEAYFYIKGKLNQAPTRFE